MLRKTSLWESVLAGLIVTGFVALLGLVYTSRDLGPLNYRIIISLLVVLIAGAAYYSRRRFLRFVPYISGEAAKRRVANAQSEIWSFQISGGEFTTNLVGEYDKWLRQDPKRILKLLFANPANAGLIDSIVQLSGSHRISSGPTARRYLRDSISTSLEKYSRLQAKFPKQVDLRIYDTSPPCSIHAVDVVLEARGSSIFIEYYLPELRWGDRPCILLRPSNKMFVTYRNQGDVWFENAAAFVAGI